MLRTYFTNVKTDSKTKTHQYYLITKDPTKVPELKKVMPENLPASTGGWTQFQEDGQWVYIQEIKHTDKKSSVELMQPRLAVVRALAAQLVSTLKSHGVKEINIDAERDEDLREFACGLEVALYKFTDIAKNKPAALDVVLTNKKQVEIFREGQQLGQAVNLARHLVNLPPNQLHPESFEQIVKERFKKSSSVEISVVQGKELKKEGMNLLAAVGAAGESAPRLIHIKYRPGKAQNKSPIAIVGKGITFDSGGLDIKPSSGMRLMKKDMGGSAAVVGILDWCVETGVKKNIDFYLALAENGIGPGQMRPGDVYTARSGHTIEIDNTDAEGRLVLADAMDYALSQKDKPSCLIDFATLTGAIKAVLGGDIGGLFSNDSKLSQNLISSFHEVGDWVWLQPTYEPYMRGLKSTFADYRNSADGFAGAMTAAQFLQIFVKDNVPWAHFDIYAWNDFTKGAALEPGGSGQGVLGLCNWLKK